MLGISESEVDAGEMVTDAIGELSNMVAGYVKSRLCDSGLPCTLTIPSVVRGQELSVEGSAQAHEASDRIPQLQPPFVGGNDVKRLHMRKIMSIKILTVDDSKTIRLIVAKAFKPFDCMVLEADNGVVGLAVASREKPDVILLDYTMPVMDGFEVLARLRSDPDLKATPVIMLTAEAGRETVIKIAKLGVRDYLIKPFKGELLVERVGPRGGPEVQDRRRGEDTNGSTTRSASWWWTTNRPSSPRFAPDWPTRRGR